MKVSDLGTMHKVCTRGSRRISVVTMKYFRNILVYHEIFLKIFDGPQKICLCFPFLFFYFFIFFYFLFFIFFFQFNSKSELTGSEHKMLKLVIKDISEKQDTLKYKRNPLRYIYLFLRIFKLMPRNPWLIYKINNFNTKCYCYIMIFLTCFVLFLFLFFCYCCFVFGDGNS